MVWDPACGSLRAGFLLMIRLAGNAQATRVGSRPPVRRRKRRSRWRRQGTSVTRSHPEGGEAISCPPTSLPRLSKRQEAPRFLIPQRKADANKTAPQSEPADLAKLRIGPQDFGKPIKGNAARQVMHVMHANVGAEPAQRQRQMVVRAAAQRRFRLAPIGRPVPGCRLELMLHIEHPDAHRRREHDNRQMDDKERRQAYVQDQTSRRPAGDLHWWSSY